MQKWEKPLNHNRADRALGEWAECPCALEQVHLLALDGLRGLCWHLHTARSASATPAGQTCANTTSKTA